MAFSFANASGVPGSNASANTGPDLQEISVESLAFKTLAGETKIKLLPSSWPTDALPSSTSSLLSISSKRGLLAAASPNSLVIAETEAVRKAFGADGPTENNIKTFTPALTIDQPRLSQVAFTSDGTYLVICAESGGGLAVYDTQSILQNKKESAFQIGTEGTAVRTLVPNPAPDLAYFVAVVLGSGQLMIANLQEKQFISGANNSKVLKDGVTCASWSVKGKQLVAGLHDGNAFQIDPTGAPKAVIRQPPQVPANHHTSSIMWLANDEFLMFHTPNTPEDPERPSDSIVHYVQTDKSRSAFSYQRINDPSPAFGMNRVPPMHFISRLRKWHHLDDMLILSSVVSTDVGLITKAEVPLTREEGSAVANAYTGTSFADDSKRASLPMSVNEDMSDTTPIGMSLDLSSKEKVEKPIPGDEMDESPFPLPAMMLLNNEGILCAWWIVYNDALRENKIYPGMTIAEESAVSAPATVSSPQASSFATRISSPPATTSAFSGFSKPAAPAFGQSTFGSTAASGSAFGGPSLMAPKPSPWGAGAASQTAGAAFGQPAFGQSAFGKPAFGSTTPFGKPAAGGAFGAASTLGQKPSPWAAQAATGSDAAKAAAPFGSSVNGPSGFAKLARSTTSASPFGALASTSSPFSQQAKPPQPAFATSGTTIGSTPNTSFGMSTQPSFGSTVTIDSSTGGSTLGSKSLFGTPAQPSSVFGKPSLSQAPSQESEMMDEGESQTPREEKNSGLPGLGTSGFKLGSTFKPDTTSKDQSDKEEEPKAAPKQKPLFGADFGAALGGDREKTVSPPIKKEPGTEEPTSIFGVPMKKPEPAARSSLFGGAATTMKAPSSFGKPSPSPGIKDPLPPQVTSKPQPSPSPATGPSTASKTSSSSSVAEDVPPLAGSEGEAVELPEEDSEDLSEEETEPEPEAALPPDPRTVKVDKKFYSDLPGAVPTKAPQPPPKAPSPPPAAQSPLFSSKTTTTPAGFPKAPTMFAPPISSSLRESPRSPSPVRSASTPVGKPFAPPIQRPISRPPSRPIPAPTPPPPAPPAQEPEPSIKASDLTDDEDERIREYLASQIEPTLKLAPFIAQKDYTGQVSKSGIPNQIERVYRDANSMIDTLGLNARSLKSFVEGHNQLMPEARSKEDLDEFDEDAEDEDSWCLVEIEELAAIEGELEQELEAERISDVGPKLAELMHMRKELVRVRHKLMEVKKFLEQQRNPERKATLKAAPLDPGHASKQQELRTKFAEFQKQLAEAEEGVVVLRTKLATTGMKGAGNVPTVEAVERTIKKMTEMAEQRSGDIDVLELQLRKLGLTDSSHFGSSKMGDSMRSSVRSSMRNSLLLTPSPRKANGTPARGRTYGLVDEDSEDEVLYGRARVDEEKIQKIAEVQTRRKKVLRTLGEAARRRGTKVTNA